MMALEVQIEGRKRMRRGWVTCSHVSGTEDVFKLYLFLISGAKTYQCCSVRCRAEQNGEVEDRERERR